MKTTRIISAFAGTGKTYFIKNMKNKAKYTILDLDSSIFTKLENGETNPEFPNNYFYEITKNIGHVDIIFISTHNEIRQLLNNNEIEFTIVVPYRALKDEYIQRFKDRGSSDEFINMMDKNWDLFLDDLKRTQCHGVVRLNSNQYISDYLLMLDIK